MIALRGPKRVVACGLLITVIGIVLASHLSLETDLSELLPRDAPSVVALRELSRRVGGTGSVSIAIESVDGKPDALRAYVPVLASALRTGLGADLLSLRYSRREISDFFTTYAAYYVTLAELTAWSEKLRVALAKQNPAYVELDEDAPDPLRALVDDVRRARDGLAPATDVDTASGLYMTEHGRLAAVFVRPASSSLDLGGSEGLMHRIEDIVASTAPGSHGVRILGYTGSIPLALGEVAAIRSDIVSTALFVIIGVGLIVALYFRGLRELLLMSSAVIAGTAVALGLAEVWIGHVNAQTAFLGSIILGTGINYGIIYLDRYRQARVTGLAVDQALETARAQTLRPTGIAALSTAVSFGVLAAGQVESFHQFGWIGGVGILACWAFTFTLVPACVALVDRDARVRPLPGSRLLGALFAAIARGCARWPRSIVGIVGVLALAGGLLGVRARHQIVETDLRKLGTRSAATTGIEQLDNRLRGMDDRSSSPAVIATDDRADTRPLCALLNERARTDLRGVMRRCYSIDDLIPADLDRRRPLLEQLRRDLAIVDEDDLAPADREDLASLRRALVHAPPTDADLPPSLGAYFVERDGSVGKLAYVEPNDEHIEANLYAFTDAIRNVHLPSGKVIQSSGELVVFADVLRAMRRDAGLLTGWAALLVLVVLAGAVRRPGGVARVAIALIAGVLVMIGIAVVLGEKLNFFNFVALPTTFGIGIDYAINIEERIHQRGRSALTAAVAEAAPAVVLASVTSVIGYASLLTADSQALATFGALAMIGEIACVVVAISVVPALWALRRRSTRGPTPPLRGAAP